MLHATRRVSPGIMWANLHLLFWQSLVPFVTGWMGENGFAPVPTALYGVVLLMAAVAYFVLERAIIATQGRDSLLAGAVGRDRKGRLSIVCYATAIGLSFVNQWLAGGLYALVAVMWLVPDARIERRLKSEEAAAQ
ncbi:MAG: hypothetical protein JWO31_2138 [Phycisphaerales bacterium]|nr:hypothetical protein [Phycisphaerales bacterium]